MREIKFRVWDELNKRYEYIDFSKPHTIPLPESVVWTWPIQQFTGLRDENGKEIYEGDIITQCLWPGTETIAGKVVFEQGAFRITEQPTADNPKVYNKDLIGMAILEVIGNIYEHPELLDNK